MAMDMRDWYASQRVGLGGHKLDFEIMMEEEIEKAPVVQEDAP